MPGMRQETHEKARSRPQIQVPEQERKREKEEKGKKKKRKKKKKKSQPVEGRLSLPPGLAVLDGGGPVNAAAFGAPARPGLCWYCAAGGLCICCCCASTRSRC